ncbi:AAA family ATPase [Paeniglutamicibacter cryotolerans]|uniref:Mrp family chromosome partitioning ATPase n=1 Tax=Paeniglutamicibacter cryotolerans TaxID=670079 RepID=A0A839QPP9_9MICC|nr:chromosome partitioning protein [Paeniglutamicibacter cryotolerans]MBB2996615.1 Mrp family chromosome partitioning ATPase [Paeniglutamicibacter cryotolerans]
MSISAAIWGDERGIVERLEHYRGAVTVARICEDLLEAVALAETGLIDVVLLAGPSVLVDAATLDALAERGIPVLVLGAEQGESERLTALGAILAPPDAGAEEINAILERACAAVSAGRSTPGATMADQSADPAGGGKVVVFWGPGGAPGRSTLAVNYAAESALAGRGVILVDADTYGASIAIQLGLLDEAAGLAQLCRLADQGRLESEGIDRACARVRIAGTGLAVATGLPRPNRWPELRPASIHRVLAALRTRFDTIVVDVAAPLELDEDLSFDTLAPQRNGATIAVLGQADTLHAVGSADAIGVPRLLRALEELAEVLPAANPQVVFNKVATATVGPSPQRALNETWERFGPAVPIGVYVPSDRAATDAALLAGTVLAETAPRSPAREAMARLAGHEIRPKSGFSTGFPRRK